MNIPANVMRYGVDEALPERRTLRAGAITAVLENADLRYVYFGGAHLVLRLYVAVRDRNWSTIPPVFTSFEVQDNRDSFEVEFTAEHVSGAVDFAWNGKITGTADGVITYRMDGAPRKAFFKNRIGFCVLHPMELAGVPVSVETPDGVIDGQFPTDIAPDQPFIDMVSISHPIGQRGTATIRFEGDLFEVEDQRNWTDASYKTYCTPLRYPYPVEVTPETRIVQSVTISVSGAPEIASSIGGAVADITIDPGTHLPLPPIGFGAGRKSLSSAEATERLRSLKPAHLWADLDLGTDRWRTRLEIASAKAATFGVPLDLSVIAAEGNRGWDELAAEVNKSGIHLGHVFAFPPATHPIVFPRKDLATHAETIAAAKSAFAAAGVRAVIGGGARAYFTELNRAQPFLPVDQLDAVTYTINPQIHAFDNLSVIETLAAQGETVRSARGFVGERPLIAGPITFKPPYNPNATVEPPPAGPDRLPDPVDPRQLSLFGAGWTLGSIHRLAVAGADALTYFELEGWRGLIERSHGLTRRELFPSTPGGLFPLYHVFAALAGFAGGEILGVTLADGLATEALVVRKGNRIRALIANLTASTRQIVVATPGLTHATVRTLDETSYGIAAADPAYFTTGGGSPLPFSDDRFTLTLSPFAIACVDGGA